MEVDILGFAIAEIERDGITTGIGGFNFFVETPPCGIKGIAKIQFLTFSKFLGAAITTGSTGQRQGSNDKRTLKNRSRIPSKESRLLFAHGSIILTAAIF